MLPPPLHPHASSCEIALTTDALPMVTARVLAAEAKEAFETCDASRHDGAVRALVELVRSRWTRDG